MKNKFIRKLAAAFLAAVSLFTTIPAVTVNAAGQTSITLKQELELKYASNWNYTAVKMSADGKMVYCVQPDLPAPPNGSYRTDNGKLTEIMSSNSKYAMYRKALYYGYGGDGFNTSNNAFKTDSSKHEIHYSGNTPSAFMGNLKFSQYGFEMLEPSGSNLHYLLTHVLLSYIYYGDSTYKSKISGVNVPSDWYGAIADLYNAVKAAPNPPVSTKLYMLDMGNKYQQVIVVRNSIKLQLQKTSANTAFTDGNSCYSLKGAKYNIYLDKNCTDYFGYITTDEKGFGKYGAGENGVDVPVQTYYAKEAEAPKGYAIDKTVYEFKNSGKKTSDGTPIYSISCKDHPLNDPITILLKKVDAVTGQTSDKLAGAEFTVKYYDAFYDTEKELANKVATRSWIIRTDEYGYAELSKDYLISGDDFYYATNSGNPALPLGTVTLQETKAPEHYQLNTELFIGQITADNGGALGWLTTNSLTPEGELIINEHPAEYNGRIQLTKTDDETKEVLANAEYGLYSDEACTKKVDTLKTGSNGIATSIELNKGTYYLKEIKAPDGYVIDKTVYPVTITASSENEVIKITLTDKQTVTEITKTDITGENEIAGARQKVTDSNSNVVDEWTSTTSAHIIKGLKAGETYTLTEVRSPDGYATTSSIEFTVKPDGTVTKVVMKDDTTKYEFVKTDESGQLIKDVRLQVIDSDTNIIADWITDGKTSYKIIGKLVVGKTYTLHEVSAPNEYALAKDISFTVKDTSELQTITMINKLKLGNVTLYKQDYNGKALAGSEWELYKSDGTKLSFTATGNGSYFPNSTSNTTLSTDSNGRLYVYDLPQGSYYFIETKAPNGTSTYGKKVSFTVSGDNETALAPVVTVKNNKIVMYETGGRVQYLYITGFVMLIISVALLSYYFKRKRR